MKPQEFKKLMRCLCEDTKMKKFDMEENSYDEDSQRLVGINDGYIIGIDCSGDKIQIVEERKGFLFTWDVEDFTDEHLDDVFAEVYDFFMSEEEFGDLEEYIRLHN